MPWSPEQYSRFSGERSRPFHDLLDRIPLLPKARRIADLGCGSGELTLLLAERWPDARVVGIDSSPEMLEKARPLTLAGRLEFEGGDIAGWADPGPFDLILSNAALQWVDDHAALLPELGRRLGPEGILAFQVPDNFRGPSHEAIARSLREEGFDDLLGDFDRRRAIVRPLAWYAEALSAGGMDVDAWETIYLHRLSGEDPVLEWIKGTALRPILAALSPAEELRFLEGLRLRLREAYPARDGITWFPFPRIFVIGQRGRS